LLGRPMPGGDFAAWLVNHDRNRPRKRSRNRYSDTSPITLFSLLDTADA